MTDELHDALARSAGRLTPSAPPLAEILRAGGARRTRRRALRAAAAGCALAAAVVAGVTVPWPGHSQSRTYALPAAPPAPAVVSRSLGQGVLDGHSWSESLVYYPQAPADSPFSGSDGRRGVVCMATTVDGKKTSPYGNCTGVSGPRDPAPSGMYGQQSLAAGAVLYTAQPEAEVVSATATFGNGAPVTVKVVTLPGTDFTAYVIPVAAGVKMHSLVEYDAQHQVIGHQTF
ncbi:hypothetical protein GXW82_21735 [Streptacidiphilus sp. 4-A2]|nr:hypothetical protein [Streptacidiphilus sp. 4-A2]